MHTPDVNSHFRLKVKRRDSHAERIKENSLALHGSIQRASRGKGEHNLSGKIKGNLNVEVLVVFSCQIGQRRQSSRLCLCYWRDVTGIPTDLQRELLSVPVSLGLGKIRHTLTNVFC